MIGVTVGTGLSEDLLRTLTMTSGAAGDRRADVYVGSIGAADVAIVPRHGVGARAAPHRIDHGANLSALKELGVRSIVAVSSTGSLKRGLKPPALMVPDDYIELFPATVHDDAVHIVPGLSDHVRNALIEAATAEGVKPFHDRGTYVQTVGPRFETKAEVRMLATFADVVGMTMGSEATVARELGMEYASLCTVDNYANGVSGPLAQDAIFRQAIESTARAWKVVERAVAALDSWR